MFALKLDGKTLTGSVLNMKLCHGQQKKSKPGDLLPAAWRPVAETPGAAGGCARQQRTCTGAWCALGLWWLKLQWGADRGPGLLR